MEVLQGYVCYLFNAAFLLGSIFDLEDGGYIFFRNVGWLSTDNSFLSKKIELFKKIQFWHLSIEHIYASIYAVLYRKW
jgi:hypothetical protein